MKVGNHHLICRAVWACLIGAICAGRAAADPLTIAYRGKVSLTASTTTDQFGSPFSIQEMSGVTFRGGSALGGSVFTTVIDGSTKLVHLNVLFNADGSIAAAAAGGGYTLDHSRDYEGIAFTNAGRNSVFLSTEAGPDGPSSVYEYTLDGSGDLLQTNSMPPVFVNARNNRGLESLTRRADGQEMWTTSQEALTVDGPVSTQSAGTVLRLQRLAVSGNTVTAAEQYAYVTEPIHAGSGFPGNSGVSDMVVLPDGTLLTLERSTRDSPLYESRIFSVDFAGATDVSQAPYAAGLIGQSYTPATKTLLFSTTAIAENLEGLCLGPQLPGGGWVLLGVVDSGSDNSANTLVAFELTGIVPEPSTLLLAILAVAGYAAAGRRCVAVRRG